MATVGASGAGVHGCRCEASHPSPAEASSSVAVRRLRQVLTDEDAAASAARACVLFHHTGSFSRSRPWSLTWSRRPSILLYLDARRSNLEPSFGWSKASSGMTWSCAAGTGEDVRISPRALCW